MKVTPDAIRDALALAVCVSKNDHKGADAILASADLRRTCLALAGLVGAAGLQRGGTDGVDVLQQDVLRLLDEGLAGDAEQPDA